jgi:hypothetical protein
VLRRSAPAVATIFAAIAAVLQPITAVLLPVADVLAPIAPILETIAHPAVVPAVQPIFDPVAHVFAPIAAILETVPPILAPVADILDAVAHRSALRRSGLSRHGSRDPERQNPRQCRSPSDHVTSSRAGAPISVGPELRPASYTGLRITPLAVRHSWRALRPIDPTRGVTTRLQSGHRRISQMKSARRACVAAGWFAVLTAVVAAQSATPPPPPPAPTAPPSVAQATARLQAQDPAGAVKILDAVTAREPGNVTAWRTLGAALLQTKEPDRAIVALEKALALQPNRPDVFYNLASAHALKGDLDGAINWLGRAKTAGNIDMTRAEIDPNLAAVRAHPKFRALLPTDADFAAPFVEPVRIIREWRGEAANDQFGWIARNIGDVDRDGVTDLVTSAPTSSRGGSRAGRVYVYSTLTGKLLWSVDGKANDQLGIGIEAAGDVNADGAPDVVASAPGRGEAYVYSGRDGAVLLTLKGASPAESFGRHVSGVGDLNRDGHADVCIGAPGRGAGSPDKGRAVVYSGKDGSVLLELTGEVEGDAFGSTVAGDPFGTGRLIVVGAPRAGAAHTGRGYVYDGLSRTPKFVIESDATGVALGAMFASIPGDVNGDGADDVYVSDFPNAAKGASTGRVYVHSGRDGRRLYTFTGETAGEALGTSPANVGDVDGDGHADILVGAWQYAGAAVSGGRAYLYSGQDGRLLKTYTCKTPGDTFGFDAVGLGDVDADGSVDFLITSAWSGVRGFHSGRVFLISSGVTKRAR